MEIVFWLLIFLLFHSYLFYPVIIKAFSSFFGQNKAYDNSLLSVSILISVFNEEKVIRERLKNIADLEYNFSLIEVIIGSDNSTDNTNKILEELKGIYPWLNIYLFSKRRGKVSVLNDLVKKANNEILLFTDANTLFNKDVIKKLIYKFQDHTVGGVSGRLKLTELKDYSDSKTEEKNYWEYETFIKRYEGKCGVLIGANGGIFTIRKELYKELPVKRPVTDDLFISLSILQQDFKFVYESDALAFEEPAPGFKAELHRKIRFGATNWHTLLYFKNLLINKNLLLSYSLWSHKVFRWLTPLILILIFCINIILLNKGNVYNALMIVQLSFCILAIFGFLLRKINFYISPLVMISYFLMTNVALFIGMIKFLLGKQTAYWQSTPRK